MIRILIGDCLDRLRELPDESVQCCVTSPPYYGLRQYLKPGHADYGKQIGLESVFDCLGWATRARCGECYVCRLTAVFAEVRRVLRKDGTLWCNLGDAYANPDKGGYQNERTAADSLQATNLAADFVAAPNRRPQGWLKPKDLMLVPERVALSLTADGWYLRSRIIWHKPAPMPESVRDRPTKSHEHIWLLSKSERYYYSEDAREPCTQDEQRPSFRGGAYVNGSTFDNSEGGKSTDTGNVRISATVTNGQWSRPRKGVPNNLPPKDAGRAEQGLMTAASMGGAAGWRDDPNARPTTRNWRDVWTIGPEPFAEAHFATFPTELPRRAIVAGSRPGDTVLDPFGGAGTTGLVADRLGRDAILVELNADYAEMARARLLRDAPLLVAIGGLAAAPPIGFA